MPYVIRGGVAFRRLLSVGLGGFMCECHILSHMEPETVVQAEMEADAEVMAAVEEGPVDQFIIADISQDDAYLTLPLSAAASLPAWR
jgi:hypothetical protein